MNGVGGYCDISRNRAANPINNTWIWCSSGATLVQLAWKGWILWTQWTIVSWRHREDRQKFSPWTGCSVPPYNSKSDALSIELRVRVQRYYTPGVFFVNFRHVLLIFLRKDETFHFVVWFLVQFWCSYGATTRVFGAIPVHFPLVVQ